MMVIMDLQLFLHKPYYTHSEFSLEWESETSIPPVASFSVSAIMSVEADILSESISDVFQLISSLACPVGSKL